jgi:hypothetical protein
MRAIVLACVVACATFTPPPALSNVELVGEPAPAPPPPAKCEPPCAAKGDSYAVRMAVLECKVACLKEQIRNVKSRLELVAD